MRVPSTENRPENPPIRLSLAENIRQLRKQRKLTQEKLAEALGVTVGAVYKWESGQSQPELSMLVELADFFDTSVDVLLGYRVRDNRLEAALARMDEACRVLDSGALTEAEKILGKYPHSFRAVYSCAVVYLAFGAGSRDPGQLKRALELLEQARVLLPQNDDPSVGESTICGNLSAVWSLLGNEEKCVELLRKNNASGVFNSEIGFHLAVHLGRTEEAAPYLAAALMSAMSNLLTTVISYVFVFRARRDWASVLDITQWGIAFLTGLKTGEKQDLLEKTHAEMLVLLAYAQARAGLTEDSAASLAKAAEYARHFDSMPEYSLKTMRFADLPDELVAFDVFGATACDSIMTVLSLLGDEALTNQWKEVTEHGN